MLLKESRCCKRGTTKFWLRQCRKQQNRVLVLLILLVRGVCLETGVYVISTIDESRSRTAGAAIGTLVARRPSLAIASIINRARCRSGSRSSSEGSIRSLWRDQTGPGLPMLGELCEDGRKSTPKLYTLSSSHVKFGRLLVGTAMLDSDPTVLVIDDDPDIRSSVGRLVRSVGLHARLFASVPDFLKSEHPNGPSCLVLDVRLPGPSGLDFQRELEAADVQIPVIFITGHGDVAMSVQAMKRGAIEFLTKPFRDQDLIDAIHLGLNWNRAGRENENSLCALRAHLESLTPRERGIMIHIMQGRLDKQIAGHIGISEPTVKVHRSNLMRKMNVRSVVELGRMADRLNLLSDKTEATIHRS
jgi:FixJ family two-component response regulator